MIIVVLLWIMILDFCNRGIFLDNSAGSKKVLFGQSKLYDPLYEVE